VLIGFWSGYVVMPQNLTRLRHAPGEFRRLGGVHTAKKYRHQQGCQLVIRPTAVSRRLHKCGNILRRKRVTIPFLANDIDGSHGGIMASRIVRVKAMNTIFRQHSREKRLGRTGFRIMPA
jgi:hypothetical protein